MTTQFSRPIWQAPLCSSPGPRQPRQWRWRAEWQAPVLLIILTAASLLLALAQPLVASASGRLVLLSTDPYTNRTSQHQTEVEPDIYASGSTLVSDFQAGRFFGGASSNIGWATSHDAGRTWRHGFLPGTTVYAGGTYDSISDPTVAYDAAHRTWLISALAVSNTRGNDILVSRSTDGGLTWMKPVAVSVGGPRSFYDKDWIVCDDHARSRFYGHCYVEWDNAGNNGQILMSTSNDGGLTWGAPKSPANQNFFGIGGQPLVQPNGTVIVPITNAINGSLVSFSSTNGGASWGSAVTIALILPYIENNSMRNGVGLASAQIDGSGKVYIVWSDCRFEPNCLTFNISANDLVMSTSTDGKTWSAVQRIPIDPVGSGVDHIIPGIGIDKATSGSHAHIGLAFYYFTDSGCFTYNCKLDVGFVSSTNGGATWSRNQQLAGPMSMPWLADTSGGFMVGDYIATAIVRNIAYPVFAVATAPSGGHLNESMYTTAALTITGGSLPVQTAASPATATGSRVSIAHTAY